MGSRGRNTKLTPEITKKILDALRTGAPRKYACRSAGVSDRTMFTWLSQGRARKTPETIAFFSDVQKAEADGICQSLKKIQQWGKKDWKALAWMLEKRFPEEFSSDRRELRELRGQVAELMSALLRLTASESATTPPPPESDSRPDSSGAGEPRADAAD